MRYIALGIILLFTGCLSSNRITDGPDEKSPTIVSPEKAGTIDRNNDGVVSGDEIDTLSNSPNSLTVFIWLICAVIIAVVVTVIISRWSAGEGKENPEEELNRLPATAPWPKAPWAKKSPIYVDKKSPQTGEGVSGSAEANTSTTTDTE